MFYGYKINNKLNTSTATDIVGVPTENVWIVEMKAIWKTTIKQTEENC